MDELKIGNWLITGEGIRWAGTAKIDYIIPRDRILEAGTGDRSNMYDWLVHMVDKTWLTEEDIYTLNTAFVFAIAHYGLDFTTCSFADTLVEQQREISDKY